MKVQSNGLPDHCYSTPYPVKEQKIEFTFKFNPSISSITLPTPFANQEAYDTASCTLLKTKNSNINGVSQFSSTGTTNLDTSSGIALNGVLIHASSSIFNLDPYYPKSWSGQTTYSADLMDQCLGHPEATTGIYHYHILPPCLVNAHTLNTDTTCSSCGSSVDCSNDLRQYALDQFASYKTDKILGIAKDGHTIVGPYKTDGTLYDCTQLDTCGGTSITDGAGTSYVYVWQHKYPYVMDCFGPGAAKSSLPSTVKDASCTSNGCISSSIQLLPTFLSSLITFMIAVIFLI